MKRSLAAGLIAAGLAVTGCGTAQGSAPAQGSRSIPGVSSGRPAHSASPHAPLAPAKWLPVLSARQVAAGHLLPQKWILIRLAQGDTAAEIGYSFGGCLPQPEGALVVQSADAVTLSLETRPSGLAGDCAPVLAAGVAWVRIPALAGRALRHAPLA